MSTRGDELREEARGHYADAEASFERCDTDGFLSQWASDITARMKMRQADIEDNDGLGEFAALFDADTREWVPSKLIDARYGTCWALLDDDGNFTGEFVTAFPKRRSTMVRKGYLEGRAEWPAKAKIMGSGTGLSGAANAYVGQVKVGNDLDAPVRIVTTDRWEDEA